MRNKIVIPTIITTRESRIQQYSEKSSKEPASALFVSFGIKEQVLFAKRLSFLMKAGVSILDGMTMIRNQTKSKRMQQIFDTIITDVAMGKSLSKGLERYPHIFGSFTIHIIHIGETAGVLSENLAYLADELSKKYLLQRKVRSALIYPLFITVATLGVTSMLMVFIFPKIMPIFISLNVTLPFTTRALLAISTYLAKWGFLTILGCAIALILLMYIYKKVIPFRHACDWILIRLPIAGDITRSFNCANFCRTLGLTVQSGMHLSEAMHATASITDNLVYKKAYLNFADHILKGEKISLTMTQYPYIFPDMLPQMIRIGESTGSLTHTLKYLSELYEAEVEESTKNLSNSVEPLLLLIMGSIVGVIAVSVISPIYEVTKHLNTTH
jgi:type IV pilus assembly protein PilC